MRTLLTFGAYGLDPVPWTVPDIGNRVLDNGRRVRFAKRSRKSDLASGRASLADWQRHVASAAKEAVARAGLKSPVVINAPVHLKLEFFAETPPGFRHGQLWDVQVERSKKAAKEGRPNVWTKKARRGRTDPDLTNLVKSTEDALEQESVVLANDVKVRGHSTVCLYGPYPGVRVTVSLYDESDHPGHGDVVP